MMLPFWDFLHCSQHTLTHASAVRHFLPLLLLTITLLIHTNRTALPIADLSPSHVHHVSFFCYPTLIPMIYYTTTNSTSIPTTHATRFWIRRTTAYFCITTTSNTCTISFNLRLHILTRWKITPYGALCSHLRRRLHLLLARAPPWIFMSQCT